MKQNPIKDDSFLRKGLKKLFAKHDNNQGSKNSKIKNSYADNVTTTKQQQKNVKFKHSARNSKEPITIPSLNILNENKDNSKVKSLFTQKSCAIDLTTKNSKKKHSAINFDGNKSPSNQNQRKVTSGKIKGNNLLNKAYWEKLNKSKPKEKTQTNTLKGPISINKLKKNKINNVKSKRNTKQSIIAPSYPKSQIYINSHYSNVFEKSKLKTDPGLKKNKLKTKINVGGAASSLVSKTRKLKKRKLKNDNALIVEGNCAKKTTKTCKRKRTKSFVPNLEEIKKPKCTEVSLLPPSIDGSEFDSDSSYAYNSNEEDIYSIEYIESDSNVSSFYTSDDDDNLSYSSETSDNYSSTTDSLTFLDDSNLTDPDYEPPDNIQIIKKGTAIYRTLEDDEVQFVETDELQIVELTEDVNVKSITQPKCCEINELKKLNSQCVETKMLTENKTSEKSNENDDDCPDLVPIVNECNLQSNNVDISHIHHVKSCCNSSVKHNFESDDTEETEGEEYEIENACEESYENEYTSDDCPEDEEAFEENFENEDIFEEDSEQEEDSEKEDDSKNKDLYDENVSDESEDCCEDEEFYDKNCDYEDIFAIESDDETVISMESVEDDGDCSDDSTSSIDILTKYIKPNIINSKPGRVKVDIIDASNCSSTNFPNNSDFENGDVLEIIHSFSKDVSRSKVKICKIVSIPIISELDLLEATVIAPSEEEDAHEVVSLYQNRTFHQPTTSTSVAELVVEGVEVSKKLSAQNSCLINEHSKEVVAESNDYTSAVVNEDIDVVGLKDAVNEDVYIADLENNSDAADAVSNDSESADATQTISPINNDSREVVNLNLNTNTKHILMDLSIDDNNLNCTANTETSFLEQQNLNSVFYHSFITNQVLVHLKEPLSIYGTVTLTPVIGSVSIYGHTPQNSKEFQIFSPRGCSTVEIIPSSVENVEIEHELNKLKGTFISRDLRNIEKEFVQQKDAVVILKCNEKSKKVVQIFKDCMKENVFPKYRQIYTQGCICESNTLLECIINKNNGKAFKIQQEWKSLRLKTETKMMIVGGKSVGKSTLVRYMINYHLNTHGRILLIDLDIGQSEMFLPQTVSCFVIDEPLLGPGFFQNKQPAKAYFVGHTSILVCSHRYLGAAKTLIEYCHNHEEYSKLPWVINTMGYNKGFGLELLALICQYLKPTDVVQIQSNKEINNFNEILNPEIMAGALRKPYIGVEFILNESYIPVYTLHVINTAVTQESRYQKSWDMTPKDLRYSMMLSRLSVVLSESGEGLTANPPLKGKLADVKILKPFVDGVDQQTLLKSIDTNLVYLCRAENLLPPECYGIGIVTGVDYTLNQIFLLPALPYKCMENVNCVALSDVPIPTALLKHQSKYSENSAPLLYSAVDTNAFKSVKQIYHRSAEFLTGNRKSLL